MTPEIDDESPCLQSGNDQIVIADRGASGGHQQIETGGLVGVNFAVMSAYDDATASGCQPD